MQRPGITSFSKKKKVVADQSIGTNYTNSVDTDKYRTNPVLEVPTPGGSGEGEGLYEVSLTLAWCNAEMPHRTQDHLAQVGSTSPLPQACP